ncbi:alpha-1,2-fucosyltransferase [Polynucleobacter sp. Nonnen-W13]|uniref:alpha-1,2-fucosyltransferase n=1 Tax=Polynucleobacter sp. Nonnen-W13 TaxID=1855625 RepID=UPI001C0E10CA|nr:alpha-1,2-fucosyltransferase [Polynucleobacter sp. Nonnen-W13]MBU3558364.1 alpha-1,2-fucosyltransferase [Polynucleobacter sp. Nonnen-W13]
MIYSNLSGGLGNQLFQYVFSQSLSKIRGDKVVYITDSYNYYERNIEIFKIFNIEKAILIDKNKSRYKFVTLNFIVRSALIRLNNIFNFFPFIFTDEFKKIDQICTYQDDVYLHGYWQDLEFINIYDPDVINSLVVNKNIADRNKYNADEVSRNSSVGVHIRRGDFFSNKNINSYAVCDEKYYVEAINILITQQSTIYVFSDDINFVKNNFSLLMKFNVKFINISSVDDFYVMSMCSNLIISNSSYSWWAARLGPNSNKKIICPKNWSLDKNISNISLDGWIKI